MARTQVTKTDPAIKKILKGTLGDWRGWKVFVDDDPAWSYQFARADGYADQPLLVCASVVSPKLTLMFPRGEGPTRVGPPVFGDVVVEKDHAHIAMWHSGSVTLHIPALDEEQLAVARDEMLEHPKSKRLKELLTAFGPYAGIVRAILVRQVQQLGSASEPARLSAPTSARLEREITAFMQTRAAHARRRKSRS